MSNYKNVRLEEPVYAALLARMRPRESMSQNVQRLLDLQGELEDDIETMHNKIEEDRQWNLMR